jgi:hypothetical protein
MPRGARSQGVRQAEWIWMDGRRKEVDCHLVFRKAFHLAGEPVEGRLRIAASDQYRLFVNGRHVGDGPARSEIPTAYVDAFDLAELGLRRGDNCIAVLAHSTMLPQHGQSLVPGGLWLEMECSDSAGRRTLVRSDGSWRVAPTGEYVKPAPRRFFAVGFNELVDFARSEAWAQGGFDDHRWQRAAGVNNRLYHRLVDRPVPRLRFEDWRPKSLRACGTVGQLDGVHGLSFPLCPDLPGGEEIVLGTYVWSDRARTAQFSFGCDNWSRLWLNGSLIWEQGRPDAGFRKHLEYDWDKYPGMVQGNGHRFEPGSSRLSQGQYPQLVRLRRGWNEVKVWIWRPAEAYGFELCFLDPKTLNPIPTIGSAGKDKAETNTWSVLPGENSPVEAGRPVGGSGMGVSPMSSTAVSDVSASASCLGKDGKRKQKEEEQGRDAPETHGQDAHATHGQDAHATHGQDGHATRGQNARATLDASHLWDWDRRQVAEQPHEGAHALLSLSQGKGPLVLPPGGFVEYGLGRDGVGFIDVELRGPAGTVVDVTISEAQRLGGRIRSLYNGLWQTDRLVLDGKWNRWLSFDRRAGRYLGMVIRQGGPVEVRKLSLLSQHYPTPRLGRFECSDWVFTRMWSVGAATVDAATFDLCEDCPTREKAQWGGDTYLRMFEVAYLWGDLRISAKGIREFAEDQKPDRWARPMVPSGYGDKLVEYCFLLPEWARVHYDFTGDMSIVRDAYEGVGNLLSFAKGLVDRRGFAQGGKDPRNIVYIDYTMPPTSRCGDTIGVVQCTYLLALESGAKLAEMLGDSRQAQEWAGEAKRLRQRVRESFWVEKEGLFADGLRKGRPGGTFSAVSNYWMLLVGIPDARQEEGLLGTLWPAPGRENLKLWSRGESPYSKFFMSQALLERGLWRQTFASWRGYYGSMLRHPEALSVFETWRREWIKNPVHSQNSLVHPFAIGPMAHLMMYVAGVRPLRPGYDGVLWQPMPGDLEWMKAEVPLVGRAETVRVEMERMESGGRRLVLHRPRGLEVLLSDKFLAPEDRMEVVE